MTRKILLAVGLLVIFIINGCGAAKDPNKEYVRNSNDECKSVLFTCPQYQEIFTDDNGCGCKKTSNTKDNPDARSLVNLVQIYLETKIFPSHETKNIFAEYVVTDITENKNIVNYQLWVVLIEYVKDKNGDYKETSLFTGPMILEYEQTNRNYIMYKHELIKLGDVEQMKKLSEKSRKIVENVDKRESLTRKMIQQINDVAALSYGMIKQKIVK